ncbi:hypothetical protein BO83DRAFT_374981 [Aspergillus eucalypticola CBS 122712]|uniref:Uncharacterized protein n=1 Tax=Aspergillus eucalypticola (strain CBS 122712 / IBT 29274) TaxID=1448314 RepID=A0A317W9A8_ASPEC|nr:uncharacterized protein BO83DRAFT_374981 [Aspergillus eucalypticola CBS 122712]PWY82505.1 hypothetical protein BO83DRAFT_374981 [Aspergillus eucalypticola CBS 122712]
MFDLITAFAIFALTLGGPAAFAKQRSAGFSRGQKIAFHLSLILYLCGASLLVLALLWRGLMCFRHEKLVHILVQVKNLYASLDGASSVLLLVSAGLFFFGLCLRVALFMRRCWITRKVPDGRKPVRSFSDKQ